MKINKLFKVFISVALCFCLTLSGICQSAFLASAAEADTSDNTGEDATLTDTDDTSAAEDALDDSDNTETQVSLDTTIVTLGADLSDEQRATVLSLLDLTEAELEDCIILEITNDDEHHYLDEYLSSDVIGKRALSSIRLDKAEEGSGITVTAHNINYCTESMYVNALATAGLEDANVVVAGPFDISGTAALVGTIKAYEALTGETVSEEVIDAATDELVTTGELSSVIGDADKASELIGYVKNEVIANDLTSDEDIREVIEEAANEMDITLSDEDVDKVVETMKKISKLDLDVDRLKEQAKGLYDKLKDLNIDFDSEKAQGFFQKIVTFFTNIYEKIKGLFH